MYFNLFFFLFLKEVENSVFVGLGMVFHLSHERTQFFHNFGENYKNPEGYA